MNTERCMGCGGEFVAQDGPVHRYMKSTAACWAAFGRVLAVEYSTPSLLPIHRLSVDAYAVQHPGDGSRQAIQSVGLHLCRLSLQLERQLDPAQANRFMLRAGAHKALLPKFQPPLAFTMTVAEVATRAGSEAHEQTVRAWAAAAWQSWSASHSLVQDFINSVLERKGPR
jgi:hypothetical protein